MRPHLHAVYDNVTSLQTCHKVISTLGHCRRKNEDADGEIGRGDGEHAHHERRVAAACPSGDDLVSSRYVINARWFRCAQ